MDLRANADALGGAAAAAISVIAFYPLEIIRVYLQTQTTDTHRSNDIGGHLSRIIRGLCDKGIALRLCHTLVTSFAYYRLHKFVLDKSVRRRTIYTNIFASNFAAMLTVILTMPIEGLVLRAQKASNDAASALNEGFSETEREQIQSRDQGESESQNTIWDNFLKFYGQGLSPALLLCLNPMIHYTIYDLLKLELLNRSRINDVSSHILQGLKTDSSPFGTSNGKELLTYDELDSHQLGMKQAFLVGIIAKAVATIFTFPLLRAKVLMMTNTNIQEIDAREEIEITSQRSDISRLLETLWLILKVQGLPGLYTGIFIHLIHTTFRGAISMSLKESIVKTMKMQMHRS